MSPDQSLSQTEQDKIYHWLIHGGREGACDKERAGFQRWLAERPERAQKAESIQALWDHPDFYKALQLTDLSQPHGRKTNLWNAIKKHSQFAAVASILAIACGFSVFKFAINDARTSAVEHIYRTPIAQTKNNMLDDGSTLNLSANTAVSVSYSGDARELKLLQGEATFDVAKDPQRPFVVKSGNVAMTAVGTAFNVDQRDQVTELTVFEGQVKVTLLNQPEQTLLVTAGQQLQTSGSTLGNIQNINLSRYHDWRQGRIQVENMPLSELLIELNRYSNTRLIAQDPDTGSRRVSGNFSLSEIENNIKILATLHNLDVFKQGDSVIFSGR